MLVLSRKESERIRVGDSIVVTVVRLTKDRVRLGIEAPDDVLVLRDELEKEEELVPVAVPQVRTRPAMKATVAHAPLGGNMHTTSTRVMGSGMHTAPGRSPLASKMSCFASDSNGGLALKEETDTEMETISSSRRCPERKFFRY